MSIFGAANILLPQVEDLSKWSVIACDQFTSQPEYWTKVKNYVGEAPSALNITLPEVYLCEDNTPRINNINATMEAYHPLFKEYPQAFIYVERQLLNGTIRKGVIGAIDLETYSYASDAKTAIRATERTVIERIPPRKQIRQNASIELPHILLLCDDPQHQLIEGLTTIKDTLPKLYDFELMERGGHITGWLVADAAAEAFTEALTKYQTAIEAKYAALAVAPIYYAVGDGNHSLATAKACYEDLKAKGEPCSLARYSLVELGNLHDDSLVFEPIHRIVKVDSTDKLLDALQEKIGQTTGIPIKWLTAEAQGIIYVSPEDPRVPVGILQEALDQYLATVPHEIDYIHGEAAVEDLSSKPNAIGFLVPGITKDSLFPEIAKGGVLPRKTFSMGHAEEKRYYLEARRIR